MATRLGEVKALSLSSLAGIRAAGLNTMDLEDNDELVSVRLAQATDEVMMVTARGHAIHFPVAQAPRRSRTAGGVRGIRLAKGDVVVAMEIAHPQDKLMLVSSQGFGKLVRVSVFRRQTRGAQVCVPSGLVP